MNPYVVISTCVGVAGLGLALRRFRYDETDKQANVKVESIEWAQDALRIRFKNYGGRAVNKISVHVRMIDYLLKYLPAPNLDDSRDNELAPGETFEISFPWLSGSIYTHIHVQVIVTFHDARTGKQRPPKEFYYIWGEFDTFRPDQPFRDMTMAERARLTAFLTAHNYRNKIGRDWMLMIPSVPEI